LSHFDEEKLMNTNPTFRTMPFTILQQEAPGGVRLGNMVNYASRGLYSAKSNSIWNTHHFAI